MPEVLKLYIYLVKMNFGNHNLFSQVISFLGLSAFSSQGKTFFFFFFLHLVFSSVLILCLFSFCGGLTTWSSMPKTITGRWVRDLDLSPQSGIMLICKGDRETCSAYFNKGCCVSLQGHLSYRAETESLFCLDWERE